MELDHVKGEVKVLADDSQVWHVHCHIQLKRPCRLMQNEDRLLAEGFEQRNVEGESSLEMAWWLYSWWHAKWKKQGLHWTSRDWMPCCIWHSHDVWVEGSFCHWRTHDRGSIIHHLLKCCFKRQCADLAFWLLHWTVSTSLLVTCRMHAWMHLAWRRYGLRVALNAVRIVAKCWHSPEHCAVWSWLAFHGDHPLHRPCVTWSFNRWRQTLMCGFRPQFAMTVSSVVRWYLFVSMTYFLSHTSPDRFLIWLLNCTPRSQAVTRHQRFIWVWTLRKHRHQTDERFGHSCWGLMSRMQFAQLRICWRRMAKDALSRAM